MLFLKYLKFCSYKTLVLKFGQCFDKIFYLLCKEGIIFIREEAS